MRAGWVCWRIMAPASVLAALMLAGAISCVGPSAGSRERARVSVALASDGKVLFHGIAMTSAKFAAALRAEGYPPATRIVISIPDGLSRAAMNSVFKDIVAAGYRNAVMTTERRVSASAARK